MTTIHRCHALGCRASCPPRWLMCRDCWAMVPADLQAEIYRTVKLRGRFVDASWAPWWRAQARAIAHIAFFRTADIERCERYLEKEMLFAELLEARTP